MKKEIKLKTTMLKSSLCGYRDAYILVKGRIIIVGDSGLEKYPDAPRIEAIITRKARIWKK